MKFASHHVYHIHWSRPSHLTWKRPLLLICQIFWVLVNPLAANEKYSVLKRGNLTMPIEMQLSWKRRAFSQFFAPFLKSIWNFEQFEKKDDPYRFCISEITDCEKVVRKTSKSPVWGDPSTSSMVNLPNHFWNLHDIIFIIFIDHCQVNWVRKSICFWHAKSCDCLLTHWLPMKSVLFLIETI